MSATLFVLSDLWYGGSREKSQRPPVHQEKKDHHIDFGIHARYDTTVAERMRSKITLILARNFLISSWIQDWNHSGFQRVVSCHCTTKTNMNLTESELRLRIEKSRCHFFRKGCLGKSGTTANGATFTFYSAKKWHHFWRRQFPFSTGSPMIRTFRTIKWRNVFPVASVSMIS